MNGWWIKLARYAIPHARGLALILSLAVVGIFVGLLAPWPLKLIIDNVLRGKPLPRPLIWLTSLPGGNSSQGLLAWLAAGSVALFLLRRLTAILQSYIQAGTGSRMAYRLALDLYDHLQHRSMSFHGRRRTGDLLRRVTSDTACVRELVLHVYLPMVTAGITILATFFVMWHLIPALALFAMALTIPLGFVIRIFARPMSDRKYREWELQGEIAALIEQTLTAIPLVQAYGREEHGDDHFRRIAHRTVQANLYSELSQHQFRVSTNAVNAVAMAVTMTIGGYAVLHENLSIGSLPVLISYFAALYAPVETLAYLSEGFASSGAGARRVLEILEKHDDSITDLPDARPFVAEPEGVSVRFDHVSFGYEPNRPILQEISFTARPGEMIALIGPTGAGKSTLASLIPRFFDPWEGTVYFGATDIRQLQVASVRQRVAIVLQESFLLPRTIAENIAYGRPAATREEVIAAAIAAKADEFIRRLPAGYDTVIGERGATLSGGEKQRLSIARALLKDAPILILDEPTASVDAATEAALVESIENVMKGRTTFIIAHRQSTIRRANQVLVIESGRVR